MSTGRLYRILVVDNDTITCILTVRHIESLGFRADAVSSGEQALASLRKDKYDAVLMDCKMPGMDGYETTRRLRQDPRFAGLAVIAHTGSDDDVREQCLEAGMDGFLTKPIVREEMARVLTQSLERRFSIAADAAAAA
jgi:CheY-like chemotaxis protein